MSARRKARRLSAWQVKWMLNLYPPFLFNRIRVLEVGRNFRSCRVRIGKSFLTRNLQGTTFGGTIFSGADPIYPVLYWQIFAHSELPVQAWLKSASIRYLKPARSALTLDFRLDEATVDEARTALERDGRYERSHTTEAFDREDEVCAVVEAEVHLRRPRERERETSTF